MTRLLALSAFLIVPVALATPTEAEKAKKAAEKKLDAFEKAYGKDLSRKQPERLEKDVEGVDEALAALKAVDPAAAEALQGRRDSLVEAARAGVASAQGEKAEEKLEKKFAKLTADFDPEKKKLINVDKSAIERARRELDALIAPLEGDAKKTWEGKRDALFAKLDTDRGDAALADLRRTIGEPPPAGPVAPMPPTWCDGVLASRPKLFANFRVGGLQPSNTLTLEGLDAAVAFSCVDPDFDRRQQWVAAWRSALAVKPGFPAAVSQRLLELGGKLFVANARAAAEKDLCVAVAPLERGTAEDRATRALVRIGLMCGNRLSDGNGYAMSDLDLPGGIRSQLARAQLVLATLNLDPADGNDSYQLTQASTVGTLRAAAPLDAAAFEKELEGMALSPLGQVRALTTFYSALGRMDAWVAALTKLEAKVPGLKKLAFDAPAAGVVAFDKDLPKTKPLIDLIVAMEAQRTGLGGCAQKLWAHLPPELKGKKEPVNALAFDGPTGSLLVYALTLCGRADPEAPVMETIFRAWADRSDAVRGPLGAAYQAYVAAYNDTVGGKPKGGGFDPDKRGGPAVQLGLPAPGKPLVTQPGFGGSVHGEANPLNRSLALSGGVVKAVEAKGATVKISFRTETFKVPDYSCVETNKIDRITPEGTIVYRSSCTKIGEHEATSTLEPIEVPAWAAGGVKAGSYLTATQLGNGQAKGRGWILEAWDSKAQTKRTSLFGVEL